jgi:hypothetical protein
VRVCPLGWSEADTKSKPRRSARCASATGPVADGADAEDADGEDIDVDTSIPNKKWVIVLPLPFVEFRFVGGVAGEAGRRGTVIVMLGV